MSECCGSSRPVGADRPAATIIPAAAAGNGRTGMVVAPAGTFRMGSDGPEARRGDGEGPARDVEVSAFLIDETAVTNAAFAAFVDNTGYVTDAEHFGWSFVFHAAVLPEAADAIMDGRVSGAPWWRAVRGAFWRCPDGPGSDWADRSDHPVVHVSWHDASAYAAWLGKRLPTEAEWEKAARGGRIASVFPWGDTLLVDGQHRCNIWQGEFPRYNAGSDGHLGTATVRAFPPNDLGLYQMIGNVWEWCADNWSIDWHRLDSSHTRVDPQGPPTAQSRVVRGGSHLCHESYCNRYRVSARTSNTPDSSTGHTGFRCAADLSV